jgi:hypothetical protein
MFTASQAAAYDAYRTSYPKEWDEADEIEAAYSSFAEGLTEAEMLQHYRQEMHGWYPTRIDVVVNSAIGQNLELLADLGYDMSVWDGVIAFPYDVGSDCMGYHYNDERVKAFIDTVVMEHWGGEDDFCIIITDHMFEEQQKKLVVQ